MKHSFLVVVLSVMFFPQTSHAQHNHEIATRTKIGMACSSHDECGNGQHCISEKEIKDGARFMGGYCTKFDCSFDDPCESGSTCVEVEAKDFSLCLATCSADSHCRNGYSCNEGTCLPTSQVK